MRVITAFVAFCVCLLLTINTYAQNLEFVQNKGQWNAGIQYKGNFPAGAVALKPDGGYRVMLYNRTDLVAIKRSIHGQPNKNSSNIINRGGETVAGSGTNGGNGNGGDGPVILHSHAYEINFINANPHPAAVNEKQLVKYNNYFIGNDPAKWASKCAVFNSVTYKNVYPGIDVHYYTNNGRFKYDIIVNAGGDLNNVALQITGATGLDVKGGNFIIRTTVDTVQETAPYSYMVTPKGTRPVNCRFSLNGNVLRFKLSQPVTPGTPLVIDPTVIFCSFSGSAMDNWGYTATYDKGNNFYAGGIVFGEGFQVNNGAYQTAFAGGNNSTGEGVKIVTDDGRLISIDEEGFDIGIMKFDASGVHALFATYLGGKNGNEQPHSLVVDNAGDLVIAGRSNSSDYPVKGPGKFGPGGGQDIIVSKLSSDGGQLLGSLRIGGKGKDGVNIEEKDLNKNRVNQTLSTRRNYGDDARSEVIVDGVDNIYVASCTQSPDFPVYNAYQATLKGSQNAVLLKLSPDLTQAPLFSTYLGGNGNDAAFVLKINPANNNIYTCGATSSDNFPGTSGNAGQPLSGSFLGGDCDGFISIFTNAGQLVKSAYFGSSLADQVYGIEFNKANEPFITGTTEGTIKPINAPFNAGGNQQQGKQFITKLKPDLSGIVYSANFGTDSKYPNISPTAFLVDDCENVYVSGWGGKLDGAYHNSGPGGLSYVQNGKVAKQLQSKPDSTGGFYFFVMERNASSQLYGAFMSDPEDFDGVHVDGGTSRFDKDGIIYQAVCTCGEDPGLPSDNAAYIRNGAFDNRQPFYCNLTSIKIAFDFSGVKASIKSSINNLDHQLTGCVPADVTFVDTIANGKHYTWRFNDGSPDTTTETAVISHAFTHTGLYTIWHVVVDSSSCNIIDSSAITIRLRDDKATVKMDYTKLAPCDSLNYRFVNLSVPSAGGPFKKTSFTWNFGDQTPVITAGTDTVEHHYSATGTYKISLTLTDTTYCNAPETTMVQVQIEGSVKAMINQPAPGCAPYIVQFDNTTTGGQTFSWDFGDGSTSAEGSPEHIYTTPGVYRGKLVAKNDISCNKVDSTYFTVTVSGKPVAAFTFSPVPAVQNTPSVFENGSKNAARYLWDFGDGSTLNTISIDTTVSHIYNRTGNYQACLTAASLAGCTDTVCSTVPAIVLPLADVPNAITPNGDGINDHVFVKGYGIDKINWKIYNRWGVVVFSSTDKNIGWDGRYKGVVQPQDVYTYTLDIQFTDGTRYRKTGDITLLR